MKFRACCNRLRGEEPDKRRPAAGAAAAPLVKRPAARAGPAAAEPQPQLARMPSAKRVGRAPSDGAGPAAAMPSGGSMVPKRGAGTQSLGEVRSYRSFHMLSTGRCLACPPLEQTVNGDYNNMMRGTVLPYDNEVTGIILHAEQRCSEL